VLSRQRSEKTCIDEPLQQERKSRFADSKYFLRSMSRELRMRAHTVQLFHRRGVKLRTTATYQSRAVVTARKRIPVGFIESF
jgi:hypothetical protein